MNFPGTSLVMVFRLQPTRESTRSCGGSRGVVNSRFVDWPPIMYRYNDGIHNRLSAPGHCPMERYCIFLSRANIGMTQVGIAMEPLEEKLAGEQHIMQQVSVSLGKILNKCVEFSCPCCPLDGFRFSGTTLQSNHNSHSPAHILTLRTILVYMQK